MMLILIAAGGAVGAVARYMLGEWVQAGVGQGFPWGTFSVNALGSLALGIVAGLAATVGLSEELRALISIGVLGAFTTFSTFSVESLELVRGGEMAKAAAYVGASVVVALIAAGAGWWATLVVAGGWR